MLNGDVLYLQKNNRSTNIVTITSNKIINKTIDKILDDACLVTLTTLKGRRFATSKKYFIYKLIPVFINQSVIFQPVYSEKAWNQIYINICNIKKVIKDNDQVVITFINDMSIKIEISYNRIKQYLKNCLKIKTDQLNFMKEEIYYGKENY